MPVHKDLAYTLIEPRIASYEQFFDHKWCGTIFDLVEKSPLEAAVDTLMFSWRSTDGVHRLPSLLIAMLRKFAEGEHRAGLDYRATYSETVLKGFCDKLEGRLYMLKPDQRRELRRVLARIEEEGFRDYKAAKSKIKPDVEMFWEFLLRESEFQFSIFGSQRVSYSSLFFAYEDFLASTIRTKEPTYSSKKTKIDKAFPQYFGNPLGTELADFCWKHGEIHLAMLVRHALAHNDGRFGPDLEKYKEDRFVDLTQAQAEESPPLLKGDNFCLVDGKIQITPCNTKHLFNTLKDRVTKIVEEVVPTYPKQVPRSGAFVSR